MAYHKPLREPWASLMRVAIFLGLVAFVGWLGWTFLHGLF
jgi:hypothetical protein